LAGLQKKDVSVIAAAIDEMRYNEVKAVAYKDSERIEMLVADMKVRVASSLSKSAIYR
jgi:hypothetical protein